MVHDLIAAIRDGYAEAVRVWKRRRWTRRYRASIDNLPF